MLVFSESWPWKRDLAIIADRLEQARLGLNSVLDLAQNDEDNFEELEMEAVYQVERDAMNAAFAVRRLIGMPLKVTKAARKTQVQITRFPLREGSRVPDVWDALGAIDMYDLDVPQVATAPASEMCNLFVHSFIFKFAWASESLIWREFWLPLESDPRCEEEPTELEGFLIATDKSIGQFLSFVSLQELVRVSRGFAADDAVVVKFQRDRHGRMHANAFGPEELPDWTD